LIDATERQINLYREVGLNNKHIKQQLEVAFPLQYLIDGVGNIRAF